MTPIVICKTTDLFFLIKKKKLFMNILNSSGPNNESCSNTFYEITPKVIVEPIFVHRI